MNIRWTPAAAADLEEIHSYLLEHHPHLANPTVVKIYEGLRSLRDMPHRGRPGREQGTRELLFAPFTTPHDAYLEATNESVSPEDAGKSQLTIAFVP